MKETTLYVCEICGTRYTSITEAPSEPTADMGEGFMRIPDGVDDEGLPFNCG